MTTPPRTPTTAEGRALSERMTGTPSWMARAILAIEAEAAAAERSRIYGHLVDRLWGCDADANAVLNIVEEPTP